MIPIKTMSLAALNDAELVSESVAGNRDAFGHIVVRYQTLICSLAYSATGSLSQSEDLAQDTFVIAWKQLGDLREPAKLRSWLCSIARNLINHALRRQGREPSHAAEPLESVHDSYSPEPLPVDAPLATKKLKFSGVRSKASLRFTVSRWCCFTANISPRRAWRRHWN